MTTELLRRVAEMAQPERRAAVARSLAGETGADDLIIFVRDPVIGRSLPAAGFPQTLREGRVWRALVERAATSGSSEGRVTTTDGRECDACAFGMTDGTVAVMIGGAPTEPGLTRLRILLPLFGALFSMEGTARRAEAESTLARRSAAEAAELAARLDSMRGDLQRALAIAETATRARDEFLATVSHELRTPLTSMIGWIQLLRGQDNDPGYLAEGLDTIERNARAQARLIEDILDFSRINAGKLRLDVRPADLVDVVAAALAVVRPAADAKGVRLESVLDPNSGRVSGDPDRLQQVVWNLLANAVKFTPRGGRVQVRLELIRSHCELTVTDTGEGISPEFLPYVFDRFSQADSTSTRKHSGLGLGLGIVRHLVELHGGTVQAFSRGPGEGATFAVRLPLLAAHTGSEIVAADPPPATRREGETEPFADLTGTAVLIVEDNDDARRLLSAILERCGARVETAENAESALRHLEAHRPDIMISDIEMPGEDGYSLIRKVRLQESSGKRIPAIALTAYTRSVDRVRALAAGFQMHMAKPVEPAELVAAVRSLLTTSGRN